MEDAANGGTVQAEAARGEEFTRGPRFARYARIERRGSQRDEWHLKISIPGRYPGVRADFGTGLG